MWFKVDDSFFMNPKTAMLSDGATALWLRSGSWSAQQLTCGFIPARMLPMFRGSDDSVRELCDMGLWEYDEDRDGYQFHDWSDYQPDGEEVDALRKKRSEAGKRGANRRWDKPENGKNGKTDGKCHGKPMANAWQTDGKCHGKCHGKPMANAWQTDGKSMANSCPVPVPVPDKKEKEEEYSSSSFSKENEEIEEIDVAVFGGSPERASADGTISAEYPNLDVPAAWTAFLSRHHGETRTAGEWCRLWKGWCQRRAAMSGVPPSKPHTHTWKCRHTLQTLGRSEETAQPDSLALETADRLNKET